MASPHAYDQDSDQDGERNSDGSTSSSDSYNAMPPQWNLTTSPRPLAISERLRNTTVTGLRVGFTTLSFSGEPISTEHRNMVHVDLSLQQPYTPGNRTFDSVTIRPIPSHRYGAIPCWREANIWVMPTNDFWRPNFNRTCELLFSNSTSFNDILDAILGGVMHRFSFLVSDEGDIYGSRDWVTQFLYRLVELDILDPDIVSTDPVAPGPEDTDIFTILGSLYVVEPRGGRVPCLIRRGSFERYPRRVRNFMRYDDFETEDPPRDEPPLTNGVHGHSGDSD